MPTTEELIQQLRARAAEKPETRSKRMQILVTPTLYDAMKSLASDGNVSMNEVVNVALEEYLKEKE